MQLIDLAPLSSLSKTHAALRGCEFWPGGGDQLAALEEEHQDGGQPKQQQDARQADEEQQQSEGLGAAVGVFAGPDRLGMSKLTTCVMSATSMPRAATSVAITAGREMMQPLSSLDLKRWCNPLLSTDMSSLWVRAPSEAVRAPPKEMMQPCLIHLHAVSLVLRTEQGGAGPQLAEDAQPKR